MSAREGWLEWTPPHAPYVTGRYELLDFDEEGNPEPQKVVVDCGYPGCGGHFETTCKTGAVRTHIARFGALHTHKDAFARKR